MAEAKKKTPEQNFEKSLERLEKLVADMESGSLSLDAMIERFEEGQALIKTCTGKLNEVERKIEVLVKKNDKLTTEPLDDAPPAAEASGDDDLLF